MSTTMIRAKQVHATAAAHAWVLAGLGFVGCASSSPPPAPIGDLPTETSPSTADDDAGARDAGAAGAGSSSNAPPQPCGALDPDQVYVIVDHRSFAALYDLSSHVPRCVFKANRSLMVRPEHDQIATYMVPSAGKPYWTVYTPDKLEIKDGTTSVVVVRDEEIKTSSCQPSPIMSARTGSPLALCDTGRYVANGMSLDAVALGSEILAAGNTDLMLVRTGSEHELVAPDGTRTSFDAPCGLLNSRNGTGNGTQGPWLRSAADGGFWAVCGSRLRHIEANGALSGSNAPVENATMVPPQPFGVDALGNSYEKKDSSVSRCEAESGDCVVVWDMKAVTPDEAAMPVNSSMGNAIMQLITGP